MVKAQSCWTDQLDKALVDEAMEEACVDAYNEYEQHSGFLTCVEDELQFPFLARVIGQEVLIVGMEWPKNDSFGLDLVVERDGQRHTVDARSVDLMEPLPEGHVYLAAYLDWKARM